MTNIKVRVTGEQHARLIIEDVLRLTQLSRPSIYLLIKGSKFPALFMVGRASRWVADEVRQHLADEEAAR